MKVPIKILAEGSLCIALSAALSFVRLFALPQGGSFMGGYVIHPIQALLDYPVANALIGTAGFFRANRYLGAAAASLMNLFASVLSGVVFFSDYAPEGMNVWLYSFLYNASVVIPEAVICIALIYLILPRLDKIGR